MSITNLKRPSTRRGWKRVISVLAGLAAFAFVGASALPAQAANYVTITGEGSSWAYPAWHQWQTQAAADGVTFNYTPNGSSAGRDDFAVQATAMFADSEIPFTGDADDPQDNSSPNFSYSMLPVVAGGTAFAYNLPVNGSAFTNLQLNMATIAGIFSGEITKWNAPQIAATNPGVNLPNQQITVVVRSDGSGATAQFKLWMLRQYPSDYAHLAAATGGDPNHASSYYPVGSLGGCGTGQPCFVAQSGSNGVTTYTQHEPYTIDYDEYAYPLGAGMPVAKIENAAGYYTLPTADAVAVALTQALIDTDKNSPNYLSQNLQNVYGYGDPRSYPMSMYTYEMVPDQTTGLFKSQDGAALAWISTNAVCSWQKPMGSLGYSPLPMNLVLASLQQISGIPGIDSATQTTITDTQNGVNSGNSNPCNSPTFAPGQSVNDNQLVNTAPFPPGCDSACQGPWIHADTGPTIGPSTGPSTKPSTGPSTKPSTGPSTGPGGALITQPSTGPSTGPSGPQTPGSPGAPGDNPSTGPENPGGANNPGVPGGSSTPSCDAATGICSGGSTVGGGSGGGSGGSGTGSTQTLSDVSTVIPESAGWATPQSLLVIVASLIAAIVIVPATVTGVLGRRKKGGK